MKKRQHVKILIACILVLYFVSAGALFGMAQIRTWCVLEMEKKVVTDVYVDRVEKCDEKVRKGKMTVEEAFCYITEPYTTLVDDLCMPVAIILSPGDPEIVYAQQGKTVDSVEMGSVDAFKKSYDENQILKFKKDFEKLDIDDVRTSEYFMSLNGKNYRLFYAVVINNDYFTLRSSDFLGYLIKVGIAYIVVGAVLFNILPKKNTQTDNKKPVKTTTE